LFFAALWLSYLSVLTESVSVGNTIPALADIELAELLLIRKVLISLLENLQVQLPRKLWVVLHIIAPKYLYHYLFQHFLTADLFRITIDYIKLGGVIRLSIDSKYL
jgi:hypothetical protein